MTMQVTRLFDLTPVSLTLKLYKITCPRIIVPSNID